ncbi:dynamin family protein [Ideonella sp. BN130291]|uniref:dynamin family protein n=1 Tax=Ideonella sp. BN130291 TaxID=3112940 RepID=UPI002E261A3A|nr:dynamin family protein [Ideonella sp. BN130291]
MQPSFASSLDALSGWRSALDRHVSELARYLAEHELLDDAAAQSVDGVRQRLAADKLVVAFVAEFSRGKSELINAIFFADTGRRILPATPGRTTMCTVELMWDAAELPELALLPIGSRLEGLSLAELGQRPEAWLRVPLDPSSPDRLAEALMQVMRAEFVPQEQARALGFWNDEEPDDNPPVDAQGRVEIPAWRHARINYPHPLLKRGLVILDTPGLNAIGAEPELTLSLLPTAHAAVFILGADTGVTKSDLTIWRDHLGSQTLARYVVLNKIDTLRDPLLPADEVTAQIDRQRQATAATLEIAPERVFPLSAREALAARIEGNTTQLNASRLPALETALSGQLLPQRREMLQQVVLEAVGALENQASRRLGDRRRQMAEQMLELRGLRGKSGSKVKLMIQRVDQETQEFERCTARLSALRAVHARMLRETLLVLSSDRLRDEVAEMQKQISESFFKLGAKKAFIALCERLRAMLAQASERCNEIHEMLGATYKQLNSEFGFALVQTKAPSLERYARDLDLIARNYSQYLGLSQALRLSEPRFLEQFRRMLLSKLRVAFENASGEIELWNKSASAQIDSQLRERRRGFKRRREALERIQVAATDLEQRIAELEGQDERDQQMLARLQALVAAVHERAHAPVPVEEPVAEGAATREPPALTLVASRRA